MPKVADVTGYYLNSKLQTLALIAKGVPFPAGKWMWVAEPSAQFWLVEDMLRELFPTLKGKFIASVTLMSEFDVTEFERSLSRPA
jgi:hypothetical protein